MLSKSGLAAAAIRLNKLVASKIPCSRKEAEDFIAQGFVKINGQIANSPGQKVALSAQIGLDDRIHQSSNKKVTIMLNKPLGYVSTQPEVGKAPAIKLLTAQNQHNYYSKEEFSSTTGATMRNKTSKLISLPEPIRLPKLAVAGRLDINTTGLLLFTQCGATAAQIIGQDSCMEKEYLVRLKDHMSLTSDFSNVKSRLEQLRNGITDEGQLLTAKSVVVQNEDQLLMTLSSGKRHQIRRMVRAVGWKIQAIKRVRVGGLRLGSLPVGKWRYVDASRELLGDIVTTTTTGGAPPATTTTARPPARPTQKRKKQNVDRQRS